MSDNLWKESNKHYYEVIKDLLMIVHKSQEYL